MHLHIWFYWSNMWDRWVEMIACYNYVGCFVGYVLLPFYATLLVWNDYKSIYLTICSVYVNIRVAKGLRRIKWQLPRNGTVTFVVSLSNSQFSVFSDVNECSTTSPCTGAKKICVNFPGTSFCNCKPGNFEINNSCDEGKADAKLFIRGNLTSVFKRNIKTFST